MKIAVLAGGYSPERDVSLSSGSLIANALMRGGHEVFLLDAFFGAELPPEGAAALFRRTGEYSYKVPETAPDLEALKKQAWHGSLIGKNVLEICAAADLVFVALHGAMGENGQMQSILETRGIRFTGTSHVGCVLAMDKDVAKRLIRDAGIPTAPWVTVDLKHEPLPDVSLPCVVKPCSCGSSVGVSIVRSKEELQAAADTAEKYESRTLFEQWIPGREFSVGVLDGKALPPIEIVPKSGFYDYKNKYQANATDEICPAHLPQDETAVLQDLAVKAAKALRMGSYCRLDFIREETSGTFYCLEANTLPGMTPSSLLPQEAAAVGIDYDHLCRIIVDLVPEKNEYGF